MEFDRLATLYAGDRGAKNAVENLRDARAKMTLNEFRRSLAGPAPPPGLGAALEALWHDARGDFDRAHELAQSDEGGIGDWVHAYLHRKEGDAGNAAYWYRRARQAIPKDALDAEWERIAQTLLEATDRR